WRGKGWVCQVDNTIEGFSIVDLNSHNVWALFVHPQSEGKGIGSLLHHVMLDWYFSQTRETLWLSTAPHTRAETFYRKKGWAEAGMHNARELRFEMTSSHWKSIRGRD
ncbi:MAG TPA: GNAT family N-acetyltransferase, partial [Flavisolibacter sp.]